MNESVTRDLMRSLTADLPVAAAPVGATIAGGRRLRVRRRVVAGGVAAAVAAVAFGTAGLLSRSEEPPDLVTPAANPLSFVWWADGTLHLPEVTVQIPGVLELAQVPGGVVVLTDEGEARRIDDAGAVQTIGLWRSGAPTEDLQPSLRAQDDGTVVWLDGTTSPQYSLVVYDPASGDRVASHPIPTGGFHEAAWLNEFEDGVVYWDSAAYGQRAWDIATDKVTKVGTGATFLIRVENGVWVTLPESGGGIEIISAGRRLWTSSDDPAWFSPDGSTLVTRTRSGQIRVRDALTGHQIAAAPDVSDAAGFARIGDDRQLTYVEAGRAADGDLQPPYGLISCDLDSSRCTTVMTGAAGPPILPVD